MLLLSNGATDSKNPLSSPRRPLARRIKVRKGRQKNLMKRLRNKLQGLLVKGLERLWSVLLKRKVKRLKLTARMPRLMKRKAQKRRMSRPMKGRKKKIRILIGILPADGRDLI